MFCCHAIKKDTRKVNMKPIMAPTQETQMLMERMRLANQLQDEIAKPMVKLRMLLIGCQNDLPESPVRNQIEDAMTQVDDCLHASRQIIATLWDERPNKTASNIGLTPREEQILRHLAKGEANKTIARALDVTEGTIKVHIKAILRKLDFENRTQAAIYALGHGIV